MRAKVLGFHINQIGSGVKQISLTYESDWFIALTMGQFTPEWYNNTVARLASKPEKPSHRPLEKSIQESIAQYLNVIGHCCYVWHRMDQRTTCEKGVSDFVGAWKGIPFCIEAKRAGCKTTPEQDRFLERARNAGFKTCVAFSVSDVENFFSTFRFDNR